MNIEWFSTCKKSSELNQVQRTFGPSGATRTHDIQLPNLSGILFSLVYSGFQCFLICFTYSLTLLSPLFPSVPTPYVVIYVVKNASRPVFGECSPVPDGKRFALQSVCIVTLSRWLCKRFLQGWQLSSCGAIDKEEAVYSMKISAGLFYYLSINPLTQA